MYRRKYVEDLCATNEVHNKKCNAHRYWAHHFNGISYIPCAVCTVYNCMYVCKTAHIFTTFYPHNACWNLHNIKLNGCRHVGCTSFQLNTNMHSHTRALIAQNCCHMDRNARKIESERISTTTERW